MNDKRVEELIKAQMKVRLEGMTEEAINEEMGMLDSVTMVTNSGYWSAMEKYARHMADTYTTMLLKTPPEKAGAIGGLQAAVSTWRDIIGLKRMAARQCALCRDRLAALGKETQDGDQRQQG